MEDFPMVSITKSLYQTSYRMYFNKKAYDMIEYKTITLDLNNLILRYATIDDRKTHTIQNTQTLYFGRVKIDISDFQGDYELVSEKDYFKLYKIENDNIN